MSKRFFLRENHNREAGVNPARSRHCNGEFVPHPLRKLGKEALNDEPEPGDLIAHMLYSR